MDELTKQFSGVQFKADGDGKPTGEVSARFSVFGTVDSDGDIIVRDAFTEGQAVGMVASHRWEAIIGKGVVTTDEEGAIFNGRFFLETEAGAEAFKTVKAMGDIQEWSFGFRITEQETGDAVEAMGARRIIRGLELFEVSPVLVGANRATETLAVKSASSQPLEKHAQVVRETVKAFAERISQVADLRASKGKGVNPARVEDLRTILGDLETSVADVQTVLKALEPKPVEDAAAAVAEFEFISARGVSA